MKIIPARTLKWHIYMHVVHGGLLEQIKKISLSAYSHVVYEVGSMSIILSDIKNREYYYNKISESGAIIEEFELTGCSKYSYAVLFYRKVTV